MASPRQRATVTAEKALIALHKMALYMEFAPEIAESKEWQPGRLLIGLWKDSQR
jgi:hypothetical protein